MSFLVCVDFVGALVVLGDGVTHFHRFEMACIVWVLHWYALSSSAAALVWPLWCSAVRSTLNLHYTGFAFGRSLICKQLTLLYECSPFRGQTQHVTTHDQEPVFYFSLACMRMVCLCLDCAPSWSLRGLDLVLTLCCVGWISLAVSVVDAWDQYFSTKNEMSVGR